MDDDRSQLPGVLEPGVLPNRRSRRGRRVRRHPGSEARPRRRELSVEEQAYHEARRLANAKLSFVIHFVAYSTVCFGILVAAGVRPAVITGLFWGVGLALHYVVAVLAPGMRQRWIEQEVSRQVHSTTNRQRRELHDEHARSLESLSASIAHEIRNPITAAKSLVQQMGEDPAASDNVEYAQVALEELDRVERSISHLLRYAREQDLEMRQIRMLDVVDSALETFRDRLARLGVELHREIDSDGAMTGDPEKLRRVLINLLGNALDALEQAGTPHPALAVEAGENLAGTEVWVRIRDNGPGIEPERMDRIFSPFYTSKDQGTGLGLALSKKVVDAHGGSIAAESRPGAGTEFVLTFPKQRDEAGARR